MTAEAERREGTVARVVYANPERGFAVVRMMVDGRIQTWVGDMPSLRDGMLLSATGADEPTDKWGPQFRVRVCVPRMPVSSDGVLAYLCGGVIPGIGPVMARRIVDKYGERTFDALGDRALLLRVDGVGPKIATKIAEAWQGERETATLFASLGITGAVAGKIVSRYKGRAIEMVEREPYRLAQEVSGVGFATADKIAAGVGIRLDDPRRFEAILMEVLNKATGDGHCYLPVKSLVWDAVKLARAPRDDREEPLSGRLDETFQVAVDEAVRMGRLLDDVLPGGAKIVYPKAHYEAERAVADRLRVLRDAGVDPALPGAEEAVAEFEREAGVTLAPEQREAVAMAARSRVVVLTGGPGTGKSTITKAILAVLAKARLTVALASPTGRAAKRLSEATGRPAATIHRLLDFDPRQGGFQRDERNPLTAHAVLLDEVSMCDIFLLKSLLHAVPTGARLVLVGDVDQLPSVGPGAVLRDIIDSGAVPVARLTRIFRQAKGSAISVAAADINAGRRPKGEVWPNPKGEFFMIDRREGAVATRTVVDLVSESIPQQFGFKPADIQVLSPMRKGDAGVIELNKALAARLNPTGPALVRAGITYRVGDRVMQTKNDYGRDVFNGDQGVVAAVDEEEGTLLVTIDGRAVLYGRDDIANLLPAYAITTHRFQGAESPCVVVVLLREHYALLGRNHLYTSVTRGKKLVVLVADPSAVATAVSAARREVRNTRLAARLAEAA